jgi:hypothetical protein
MSATSAALLQAELPVWLMALNCRVLVPYADRDHPMRMHDNFSELHLSETRDSRISCSSGFENPYFVA